MVTKNLALIFVSIFILFNSSLGLLSQHDHVIKTDSSEQKNELTKTYVVHVRKPSTVSDMSDQDLSSWYSSFLPISNGRKMVHQYRHAASGFAAALTSSEAAELVKKEGVLAVKEQRVYSLHTTHTPNFLGLYQGVGLWDESKLGQGVIIGLLDTGISPDRTSFNDDGVPQPPAKWKGKCNFKGTVCNNKLIGARDFVSGGATPPVDEEGHGTHTASTAAGNFVPGANVFGSANGTAAGMAPHAHVAMYRVCDSAGCFESDILAGLDAAVDDGVDVISMSLGGGSLPFYEDDIAIGSFSAISRGIFVSCSAGNAGPDYGTLSNEAPWILTVGASTIDRKIVASVVLSDGETFDGESLFQTTDLPQSPLIYSGATGDLSAAFCSPGSLAKLGVKGKVVACERGGGVGRIDKGAEVKSAGGVGMILINEKPDGFSTLADPHVLPAAHVSYVAGIKIKSFINSTQNPTAGIDFKGTSIGDSHAPAVTSFSSRGPSLASTGILKPDVVGPGVSILAAWPFSVENSTVAGKSTFNMISGTSMSCPHLAGVAALLRSVHPEWSPAAIKSAIMTTADVTNLGGTPILDQSAATADLFAIGSGHVNPPKAADPGLIYDLETSDYVPYLCGLNYTDKEVSVITQTTVACSDVTPIPESQLNYPTFSVVLGSEIQTYTRTVTNVGEASAVYTYDLKVPDGISMVVSPTVLTFTEVNQKLEYSVEFYPAQTGLTFSQGYLRWVSDKHIVRSQISVIFNS